MVRVEAAVRRRVAFVVMTALLVAMQARPTFAKEQDWWGWLEEFSGPGPFKGKEFSFEVLCINLSQRESVPVKDYQPLFDQYPELVQKVSLALQPADDAVKTQISFQLQNVNPDAVQVQAARTAELERLSVDIGSLSNTLKSQPSSGEIYASATAIQGRSLNLKAAVAESASLMVAALELVRLSGTTASLVTAGIDGKATSNVTAKLQVSKPGRKFWPRSCRDARERVDIERKRERDWLAFHTSKGKPPLRSDGSPLVEEAPIDKDNFVIERRDWQTGIVFSRGSYRSLNNKLFDPESATDNEPQVELDTWELLAHSKLSSSIDIGAGIGVALFRTEASTDPTYGDYKAGALSSKTFYLIPLSIVVRPARLLINSRWASIAGYRMSLRYFGDLDTPNFVTTTPGDSAARPYKQAGEFVWGAAAFVDGVAATEAVVDGIQNLRERLRSRKERKK